MSGKVLIDSNQTKKRRTTYDENNGQDIISNLPESITSRILSLLPTKDALRTCVLSKDWEHKWTGIYNIDVNDDVRFVLKKTRKTSFINFVDRIFFLSQNSSLKRFGLRCRFVYNAHRMISWISAALMRNVEDLDIVYNDDNVVLPGRLFDCKSLTIMKLRCPCIFRVSAQNLFSSLKSLCLAQTRVRGEHVPGTSKLVFEFPALEKLELLNCKWLKMSFVEISAPALSQFKMGLQARLLFKGFSGLKDLKIPGLVVEAVTQSDQMPPLPSFNMLKRLEVFTKCNSGSLLKLLHVMPFLESIVLAMCFWNDYDYDEVESVPSCIVSHLRRVRFSSFSQRLPDYRMAQFLCTNALQLKKIEGLRRESSEERQRKKMYGQVREESEEKEIANIWAKLKCV
ncbi:F-box/LRR-repeat protein At4g14103-like isoform X2 [Henckelia pumila]|uniref:F-box/LRR-repeat protein At4g14103-like isoform X2 n=1 Tax=Henckelia pumila TaxID=405737 RepID=UPI003C6E8CB7